MSGKVSFLIKKATNGKKSVSSQSDIPNLFEKHESKPHSSIRSISNVISLSSKGFTASNIESFVEKPKIIECRSKVCAPKKTIPNIKYIDVEISSKSQTNEIRTQNTEDIKGGLVNPVDEIDDSNELGPPISKSFKKNEKPLTLLAEVNPELYELRKNKKLDEVSLLKKEFDLYKDESFIDFDNMPVAEFGLAMLRGMGYNSQIHTSQPYDSKKRPYARAGLGSDHVFEQLQAATTT